MKYFLPTYEQAKKMVEVKGDEIFYESTHTIDGYKVSVFNYRIAQFSDFINPVEGVDHAKEMRGLTYVFNSDGSLYKRFLMLNKFWNVNQVEESLYENIKDLKIKSIYNKEDGSLITFIKLPNGKIIPKTKMGFDNDQTDVVKTLYKGAIKEFVDYCLDNELVPLFEFVSFKNKIVLNYDEPELILLRVRDNLTGKYLNVDEYRNRGFKIVKSENFTLDELMKLYETLENKEGSIVTFENGLMVKLKTAWYFVHHKLLTEDANREDYIIRMIVENTIDDILTQLNPELDKEKIEWINSITEQVQAYIKIKSVELKELISKYKGDMREYAIENKNDKCFAISIFVIKRDYSIFDAVCVHVLRETDKLLKARTFLNKIN